VLTGLPARALRTGVVAALLASAAYTATAFTASYHNYPGAVAVQGMHALVDGQGGQPRDGRAFRVHVDVATAQAGLSRFFQRPAAAGWRSV
jgi:hypothetical protein